ncbi:MAG TPA: Flp family type IVb pilin [Caulobacteraceae bacterium]|jgi:pilus assembly protein Flp/PilA
MGETRQAERLPDAAGGRAFSRLAARLSLTARGLRGDISGATAVEYGLIVAFIFLAIVGGLSAFAGNENAMYTHISNTISGATH